MINYNCKVPMHDETVSCKQQCSNNRRNYCINSVTADTLNESESEVRRMFRSLRVKYAN